MNTPGGRPYHAVPIDPQTLAVFRASDGRRSLSAVASATGLGLRATADVIRALAGPELQAMKLLDRPARPREPRLTRILGFERPDHSRTGQIVKEALDRVPYRGSGGG